MNVESNLKNAVLSGNAEEIRNAFEEFYCAYHRLVWKVVREQIPGREFHWFEDVVSEAFRAILAQIGKVPDMDSPRVYLLQSARNIAMRAYREEITQGPSDLNDDASPQEADDGVKSSLETNETLEQIEAILGHPDADIFVLREGYELTFFEIAEKLGLGEDLVYYRYKKALKKLRKEFKP